MVAKFTA